MQFKDASRSEYFDGYNDEQLSPMDLKIER